jgi:hypothetical protein
MDLRSFALPPMIIAVVGTVLYGFDAFNAFSLDPAPMALSARVAQRVVPDSLAHQPLANVSSKQANVDRALVGNVANKPVATAIVVPPVTVSTFEPITPLVSTASSSNNLVTARSLGQVEENDENLTTVANDSFADDGEPLIAATPSMATQATPVEMSDDGNIEPEAPEQPS